VTEQAVVIAAKV